MKKAIGDPGSSYDVAKLWRSDASRRESIVKQLGMGWPQKCKYLAMNN